MGKTAPAVKNRNTGLLTLFKAPVSLIHIVPQCNEMSLLNIIHICVLLTEVYGGGADFRRAQSQ